MCVWILNLVIFLLPRLIQGILLEEPVVFDKCDTATGLVPGGRLSHESLHFPWIGVLRPLRPRLQSNLHRFGKGGTMVILVRDMFAIGVADELMRLPKYLFKGFASIMFEHRGSRSYKLVSCVPHPEYDENAEEGTTVNAMALLQVKPIDPGDLILRGPIAPVCLKRNTNAQKVSDHLYAVLYNKKNFTFHKTIYSMKYMQRELCQRFYSKAGLTEEGFEPISLQCAHTRALGHSCVWESGVALISNATGPWILVGLGTKSLGCANPTRFIDMDPYIAWVEAVTTSDKWKEVLNRRFAMDHKGNLREGFKQRPPLEPPVMAHGVSTDLPDQHRVVQGKYPFDTDKLHEPFGIFQSKKSQMDIFPIPGSLGQCTEAGEVIYRDNTHLICPDDSGAMTYALTMFDDDFLTILCTKVELEALYGDDAVVYADDRMHTKIGAAFRDLGDTPEEILSKVYMNPVQKPNKTSTDPATWQPGPPMIVTFLTDKRNIIMKKTHNIHLRLFFDREAILHITVLGLKTPTTRRTMSTTETTTEEGRRFGMRRKHVTTQRSTATAPPRRFPIKEDDDDKPVFRTTWKPNKRTTHRPKKPTRRPKKPTRRPKKPTRWSKKPTRWSKKPTRWDISQGSKGRNVDYDLYKIAPETAMLKSAASVTRIQLVFIFITIFATWLLYLMHFT